MHGHMNIEKKLLSVDVPHYTAARDVADRDRRVDTFYRFEDLKSSSK